MNKSIHFILFVYLFSVVHIVNAQEDILVESHLNEIKGMYVGGQVSTNGYGFDVSYLFSKGFSLRAGFETLDLKAKYNFDENDISYKGDLNYKTGGFFLFADLNFTKNMYLSAGALLNHFNPEIKGKAVSALQYGDISIPASDVGDFNFIISPGYKISPYGGIGLRSFLGKNKRIVTRYEIGAYYIGPPEIEIETSGLLSPTSDPAHGQKEKLEKQLQQYKLYPVLRLGVAIKLF